MKDDIILPPLHYDELPEPDDPIPDMHNVEDYKVNTYKDFYAFYLSIKKKEESFCSPLLSFLYLLYRSKSSLECVCSFKCC